MFINTSKFSHSILNVLYFAKFYIYFFNKCKCNIIKKIIFINK